MFVSEALSVNTKGHLVIGGCDCIDLIKEYGTPLYVMDEGLIRKTCRQFNSAIKEYYGGNGLTLYASKAFCSLALCKIAEQEGLGLDVVSGGELYTAKEAGFPASKIYFHGNNKTPDELEMALDYSVGKIVVDSAEELDTLDRIAGRKGKTAEIHLRIKPGIDAHTHDFIKTGQIDSKFGFALETGEALEMAGKAAGLKNLKLTGLHCHIGSQIFELEPFEEAARVMMKFIYEIKKELGIEISELNLGGGFGIKYMDSDRPIKFDKHIEVIAETVKSAANELDLSLPKLLIEPGRAIAAPAGITLYTVGSVKVIPGVRKYVSVDGGMSDNPRYALYQAQHDAAAANKASEPRTEVVTIAGKCCESGDIIAMDVKMPEVKAGDYIAVLTTGAYNYSMSSNYNRIPRPPVILVKDGKDRVIVKREDYRDILRNDVVPEDI